MLARDILRDRRQYFADKVKAPLLAKIINLANKYPEPTYENVRKQNSHVLLDIVEEFFKYEDNPVREPLFRAIFRIFIAEYEHDGYYSNRIDWLLERLFKVFQGGGWQLSKPWHPTNCWTEPSTLEGRKLLKDYMTQRR